MDFNYNICNYLNYQKIIEQIKNTLLLIHFIHLIHL